MAIEANGGRVLTPRDAKDVAEILRAGPGAVEPLGRGSKRAIGPPLDADVLDLSALTGIIAYEPAELVLTAHAATPLRDIEAAMAAHGQRLAFEPPDFGPLLGTAPGRTGGMARGTARGTTWGTAQGPAQGTAGDPIGGKVGGTTGEQTLGGVLAANLAGSRRILAGAARDHFLGCSAVTGDGIEFKAGGQVVKNVTGYDLPKLLAGSWGTLAVMTAVTVRAVPRPETETTLLVPLRVLEGRGNSEAPARPVGNPEPTRVTARAVAILERALASPNDVSAAAFDPAQGAALRIEGFAASVAARAEGVLEALGRPDAEVIEAAESHRFWDAMGAAEALREWPVVWRLSVPPADAPRVVAALTPERYLLDWGGGLVWAAFASPGPDPDSVRAVIREGHATLWKAPLAQRRTVPVFHPRPAALDDAAQRIKAAFDPAGRLSPGRFGARSAVPRRRPPLAGR